MRKNQIMKLGEEEFKIKGVINMQDLKGLKFDRLESCYNRPSQAKISIYYSWFNIISNNSDILCYGVGSYNCNIFTINSIVDINDKRYYLHITPTKNECCEVVGD